MIRRFALDARSLAAGRMALAALLLVDLAQRAFDLTAHYTDDGVLPRGAYELRPWDFAWSLHTWGGSAVFEAALLALAAAFAVGLLAGYRTPWMTLGAWLLTVSLHARNPLLRDGQDDLSRVLLFWGLFLPWGEVASLDARAGRAPPSFQREGRPWFCAALVAQLCVMYWVSGVGKLLSPWWTSGDGIRLALSMGRYPTALGQWAAGLPGLGPLCFAVMALELLGPVAWLAFPRGWARAWVAAAFAGLHLGFILCMRLGLFPWVCLAAWLLLLPPAVWDRLRWPAPAPSAPPAPGPFLRRCAPKAVVGTGLLLVVWCNLLYLVPAPLPRWPQRAAEAVGLQQYWVLFSPRQASPFAATDAWPVVAAVLADGRQVDLQRDGAPVSWEKPATPSTLFRSARWRHYFANLANLLLPFPRGSRQFRTLEESRAAYAHSLCRRWNAVHPPAERILSLSLFAMRYRFDRPDAPAQQELLYQDACLGSGG